MDSRIRHFALYALGAAALVAALAQAKVAPASSRGPSTDRWPDMPAWRAASPPWCRSTNSARSTSSAPTARRRTSPRAAAPVSCAWRSSISERFPETRRLTAEARETHLRPAVHRRLPRAVPVQPHRARASGRPARSCSRPAGVTLTDLDGNRFYDLTGSYGVNVFGYDFYKECMEQGLRARARARPGARRLSSGRRLQRQAAAGRSRASTRSRSTCPAPRP